MFKREMKHNLMNRFCFPRKTGGLNQARYYFSCCWYIPKNINELENLRTATKECTGCGAYTMKRWTFQSLHKQYKNHSCKHSWSLDEPDIFMQGVQPVSKLLMQHAHAHTKPAKKKRTVLKFKTYYQHTTMSVILPDMCNSKTLQFNCPFFI